MSIVRIFLHAYQRSTGSAHEAYLQKWWRGTTGILWKWFVQICHVVFSCASGSCTCSITGRWQRSHDCCIASSISDMERPVGRCSRRQWHFRFILADVLVGQNYLQPVCHFVWH